MSWDVVLDQVNYIGAVALFVIGLYMVLVRTNLVKKVIGINIMETSVFLFFVTIGFLRGGQAPIISDPQAHATYINPLPSALILTGIVVAVSITVFALSLIIRIYALYGTAEMDEIETIRAQEKAGE